MSRARQYRHPILFLAALLVAVTSAWTPHALAEDTPPPFQISPAPVPLQGNFARVQLMVTAPDAEGQFSERSDDLTGQATYVSSDPQVVTVSATGQLLAVADGQAVITVQASEQSREVPVTVAGVVPHPEISFLDEVSPILSKAGCNSAACHASQHGKGGFKLSVFGYAPADDHKAIVRDRLQRRVDFLEPARSLLLMKPTMQAVHVGGKRLDAGSVDYQILTAWLAGGAPALAAEPPEITRLTVVPARRVGQEGLRQQLRVEAEYSDGAVRDVTAWAKYDSMDDGLLEVSEQGEVRAVGKGQAPIMVRFEGQAKIAMFSIPFADDFELKDWEENQFVDKLAGEKFRELGIQPSPLTSDATFIRRAFLDCIGTLPTPEETIAFLESKEPDKRARLVDRLLGLTGDPQQDIYNDAYAAFWTLKWSDLIRNNSNDLGEQGMWSLHNWIRESLRTNKPFDQFVRELVTAKGSIYMLGPANYFRVNRTSSDLAEATSQLFLGIRIECAKCHHHPFEKYSQADYYSFAAFFSRVGLKTSEEFGLFGREQVVVVKSSGDVRHPKTGKVLVPSPLEGEPIDDPLDRRLPLAGWLTSKDNLDFARAVVNRYMGYLLGRGLVEPIDDMRSTNPPSNPALMDALARSFIDSGFDLKQLIRTIMFSRLYQLDSQPTPANASDSRFYSHFKVKRVTAEPLLDAVDRVTGAQTKYKSLPPGTRAIELPDAQYPNYFLTTFAKPRRASVCECERALDENLAQALHTLNGDILAGKIADKKGRLARLLEEKKPHEEIVRELYLNALCRFPTPQEMEACDKFLAESPSPKECYEDLLWALINSKQFLYVY